MLNTIATNLNLKVPAVQLNKNTDKNYFVNFNNYALNKNVNLSYEIHLFPTSCCHSNLYMQLNKDIDNFILWHKTLYNCNFFFSQ